MNTSELRIGNWAYLFGDAVQLTKEHLIYIFSKETGGPEPISLTEEWLIKFGFEKDEYEAKYHKSMQTYKLTNEGWQWENIAEYAWSSVSIKHVHELQNLHWCLVGDELTIKE